MKPDKDLKKVARAVKKHPEWLEGMPEDLRKIIDELNEEVLDRKSPKAKQPARRKC